MAFAPRQQNVRLRDDPRLPIALAVAVTLSSALWGWSFVVVAGVGLALTTVALNARRHPTPGLRRSALWLSSAALAISLLLRLSFVSWEDEATKMVSWHIVGEAGAETTAAIGQKRIELRFRLHPGYYQAVYSTPLASALADGPATMPATFAVSHTVWGLGGVRATSLGSHVLCATTKCPANAVPVAAGGGGWQAGKQGPSPWR